MYRYTPLQVKVMTGVNWFFYLVYSLVFLLASAALITEDSIWTMVGAWMITAFFHGSSKMFFPWVVGMLDPRG